MIDMNEKNFVADAEALTHALQQAARSISDVLLLNQGNPASFPLSDAHFFLDQLCNRAAVLRGLILAEEEKRRALALDYAATRYQAKYGERSAHQC